MEGFINLDVAAGPGVECVSRAERLPYPPQVFGLVYACHVLEHFSRSEVLSVLTEWVRVLKPGGILRIAVPSFESALEWYRRTGKLEDVLFVFSGGQDNGFDFHKVVFDRTTLAHLLERAGLTDVREWNWRETDHSHHDDFSRCYLPHMDFDNGLLMSLNLEGTKPWREPDGS